MKIAIFSDIHGNISGLKAVLNAIDKAGGADLLIAAGDLIGGGPGTEDLLDLLHERQVRLLRGNAEEVWLDMDAAWEQFYPLWKQVEPDRDFDLERQKWMEELRPTADWLHNRLSQPYWDLLRQLPLSILIETSPGRRLMVCHSTPENTWPLVCGPNTPSNELHDTYGQVDADVIAFGHIHQHFVRTLDTKLFINVSSVESRPDIPGHSAYTILHDQKDHWLVQQMLVAYDTDEEVRLRSERQVPPL